MIKFTSFSAKTLAIASYYVRIFHQSGKFSLFFLSPYSYAKVSIILKTVYVISQIINDIDEKYINQHHIELF